MTADADRLRFLVTHGAAFDGWGGVDKDRHELAFAAAEEAGRDEPNEEDEVEGFRRLIDLAMAITPP